MNLNSILDFFNSGGFLAALFIFGYGVKKIIDVAQVIADHTKTKTDNEMLDKLKAFAKTSVTFAQSLPIPGNEQMDASKKALIQWAKEANYDLSDSDAQKFAEEQYQLIFGQHKMLKATTLTPLNTSNGLSGKAVANKLTQKVSDTLDEQQAKLLAEVNDKAAQVDPADYAIKLKTGDLVEINGKNMKLDTDDAGKITLTPEGK